MCKTDLLVVVFAVVVALLDRELDVLRHNADVGALELPSLPVAALIAVKGDVAQALPCDAAGGGHANHHLHTAWDLCEAPCAMYT